jgi:cell division septation protein DedD
MAENNKNQWWLLLVLLVVVVGAFVVAARGKSCPMAAKAPAVETARPAEVPAAAPAPVLAPAQPAVKPASAVIVPLQQVHPKDSFAVQVYSFKDKARADKALEKIKARGLKAYIIQSDLGDRGVWYRVRVGSFTTEAEAREALDQVTTYFKSGILVTE